MMQDSRTALVTGAANGIGRATCERLAGNGWNVLAVDVDIEKLAWAQSHRDVASFAADVTSHDANLAMAQEAERLFGGLDAAIFNAGVTGAGSIDEMPFEAFEKIMSVNLFGVVRGIRAALPLIRKRGGGAIAVTSSTMGVGADAENWAYGASKHAVIGLVRALSRELGWEDIRVNALCPGPTFTGMTGAILDVAPDHYESMRAAVPLQRWAQPDEMAAIMEFLVSPESSFVSGHALVADGGTVVGSGLVVPKTGARVTVS